MGDDQIYPGSDTTGAEAGFEPEVEGHIAEGEGRAVQQDEDGSQDAPEGEGYVRM